MIVRFACIVEGHGETSAVPALIHRIVREIDPAASTNVEPFRQSRSKLLKSGELERTTELAARKIGRPGGILLVVDGDDDCPRDLAPDLRKRMETARSDMFCGVVIAEREFETWFLAAANSLGGCCGLHTDLDPPQNLLAIRDAKGWLSERMTSGRYKETTHQAILTREFDMNAAALRCASFDKCRREIQRIAKALLR